MSSLVFNYRDGRLDAGRRMAAGLLAVLWLAVASGALAQQQPGRESDRSQRAEMPAVRLTFFRAVRDLPADRQQKALDSYSQYRQWPAADKQRLAGRLARWNAMTPAERQRFREREAVLRSLSSEQRDEARALFPPYKRLGDDRKHALLQAFIQMRDLLPADRQQFLSSAGILSRFSPEERNLLRGLGRLLPDSVNQPGGPAR